MGLLAPLLLLSPAVGGEEATGGYGLGSAYVAGLGAGFTLFPHGVDLDGDDAQEVPPLGGRTLATDGDSYRTVRVQIADGIFGPQGAFNVCMYNPQGDLACNADDHETGVRCGARSLHNPLFAVDFVNVFTYAFAVTDGLDVCGASTGTLTATFS